MADIYQDHIVSQEEFTRILHAPDSGTTYVVEHDDGEDSELVAVDDVNDLADRIRVGRIDLADVRFFPAGDTPVFDEEAPPAPAGVLDLDALLADDVEEVELTDSGRSQKDILRDTGILGGSRAENLEVAQSQGRTPPLADPPGADLPPVVIPDITEEEEFGALMDAASDQVAEDAAQDTQEDLLRSYVARQADEERARTIGGNGNSTNYRPNAFKRAWDWIRHPDRTAAWESASGTGSIMAGAAGAGGAGAVAGARIAESIDATRGEISLDNYVGDGLNSEHLTILTRTTGEEVVDLTGRQLNVRGEDGTISKRDLAYRLQYGQVRPEDVIITREGENLDQYFERVEQEKLDASRNVERENYRAIGIGLLKYSGIGAVLGLFKSRERTVEPEVVETAEDPFTADPELADLDLEEVPEGAVDGSHLLARDSNGGGDDGTPPTGLYSRFQSWRSRQDGNKWLEGTAIGLAAAALFSIVGYSAWDKYTKDEVTQIVERPNRDRGLDEIVAPTPIQTLRVTPHTAPIIPSRFNDTTNISINDYGPRSDDRPVGGFSDSSGVLILSGSEENPIERNATGNFEVDLAMDPNVAHAWMTSKDGLSGQRVEMQVEAEDGTHVNFPGVIHRTAGSNLATAEIEVPIQIDLDGERVGINVYTLVPELRQTSEAIPELMPDGTSEVVRAATYELTGKNKISFEASIKDALIESTEFRNRIKESDEFRRAYAEQNRQDLIGNIGRSAHDRVSTTIEQVVTQTIHQITADSNLTGTWTRLRAGYLTEETVQNGPVIPYSEDADPFERMEWTATQIEDGYLPRTIGKLDDGRTLTIMANSGLTNTWNRAINKETGFEHGPEAYLNMIPRSPEFEPFAPRTSTETPYNVGFTQISESDLSGVHSGHSNLRSQLVRPSRLPSLAPDYTPSPSEEEIQPSSMAYQLLRNQPRE